jgi:hypothetical protein
VQKTNNQIVSLTRLFREAIVGVQCLIDSMHATVPLQSNDTISKENKATPALLVDSSFDLYENYFL